MIDPLKVILYKMATSNAASARQELAGVETAPGKGVNRTQALDSAPKTAPVRQVPVKPVQTPVKSFYNPWDAGVAPSTEPTDAQKADLAARGQVAGQLQANSRQQYSPGLDQRQEALKTQLGGLTAKLGGAKVSAGSPATQGAYGFGKESASIELYGFMAGYMTRQNQ